mgnify:CR=1 FL=1
MRGAAEQDVVDDAQLLKMLVLKLFGLLCTVKLLHACVYLVIEELLAEEDELGMQAVLVERLHFFQGLARLDDSSHGDVRLSVAHVIPEVIICLIDILQDHLFGCLVNLVLHFVCFALPKLRDLHSIERLFGLLRRRHVVLPRRVCLELVAGGVNLREFFLFSCVSLSLLCLLERLFQAPSQSFHDIGKVLLLDLRRRAVLQWVKINLKLLEFV